MCRNQSSCPPRLGSDGCLRQFDAGQESGKQWPTERTRASLPHSAASFLQTRYHLPKQSEAESRSSSRGRRRRKKKKKKKEKRSSEPDLSSYFFGTGDLVSPRSSICCFDRISEAKVQKGIDASFSTRSDSSSYELENSSQGRRHSRGADETTSHLYVLQPELCSWASSVSSIAYHPSEGEERLTST